MSRLRVPDGLMELGEGVERVALLIFALPMSPTNGRASSRGWVAVVTQLLRPGSLGAARYLPFEDRTSTFRKDARGNPYAAL